MLRMADRENKKMSVLGHRALVIRRVTSEDLTHSMVSTAYYRGLS